MAKRRSLTDGLKTPLPKADPKKELAFVYDGKKPAKEPVKKTRVPKPKTEDPAEIPSPEPETTAEPKPEQNLGRTPLTTRLRSDIGAALKRASLERELAGQSPYTVQDILELALEPWLKEHGYLK